MKNFFTIFLVISYCSLAGQSIELSGLFTTTEINDFKNSFGYDVGYNLKKIKQNRISLHVSHVIKNAAYDEIEIDKESNGPEFPEYYFYQMHSKNQRLGIHLNLCHYLIENNTINFGIGTQLSYYYFIYDKKTELIHYRPYPEYFFLTTVSESIINKRNRIGIDLFAEFEIKSAINKRLNLFSRINSGLITYGTFAHEMGGWDDPWLTKWFTLNAGIRYRIKHE